ncbi:hypothetical protein TorRG33x02_286870 [Trema orientale]|uniref:Uncharacterized protein n=1 Tax=Trema orientale TaxID=63057 RepID=A0A2P5CFG8_TREOI|nr:hypothetical protein TorRG33x02_286870 [Trema orientale]
MLPLSKHSPYSHLSNPKFSRTGEEFEYPEFSMESPLHKIFTVDQMGNPAFSWETESFPSKPTFPSQFLNMGTPQNHQQRNFNGGKRSNQGRNSRTFLRIKAKSSGLCNLILPLRNLLMVLRNLLR